MHTSQQLNKSHSYLYYLYFANIHTGCMGRTQEDTRCHILKIIGRGYSSNSLTNTTMRNHVLHDLETGPEFRSIFQ